jgi:hypothetical protein
MGLYRIREYARPTRGSRAIAWSRLKSVPGAKQGFGSKACAVSTDISLCDAASGEWGVFLESRTGWEQ